MANKRSPSLTIEDIWYYYKLPILVGSAILVLVIYQLAALATAPPHRAVVLNVVLIGGGIAQERVSRLEQQATATVTTDPRHEEIAITPLVTVGPLALDSAANIKFLALLAAKSVDVVITDRQDFAAMAAHHTFLNLRSLAALGHLQSRWWPGGRPRAGPAYGVALAGLARWRGVSTWAQDAVLGIVASAPHEATAIRFARWLLHA